jgi:hypothetical protein
MSYSKEILSQCYNPDRTLQKKGKAKNWSYKHHEILTWTVAMISSTLWPLNPQHNPSVLTGKDIEET